MSGTEAVRFGQRVRQLRERLDLTQAELARRAFVSRSYIAHVETGRNLPSLDVVDRLVAALGVSRMDLLMSEFEPPPRREDLVVRILEEVTGQISGVPIPYFGPVPADVDRWAYATEEGRRVPVLPEWIGTRSPDEFLVVQASGDCLRTRGIHVGYLVLLQRGNGRQPTTGEIVLARINDEYTLKVFHRVGESIELRDGDGRLAHRVSSADAFEVVGVHVGHWFMRVPH